MTVSVRATDVIFNKYIKEQLDQTKYTKLVRRHCSKMKVTIGLLLLSFVGLSFSQFQCTTDADCVHHCIIHIGHQCREGICHCFHLPGGLGDLLGGVGRRQTCGEHGACTCADGTPGHCDHAGVCHCHH